STCHATASGSSPNTWTKDPANPILTSASVQSVLGTATLVDMAISSLVVNGGVYTFYGYAVEGTSGSPSSRSHLFRATGTTWNNPVVQNKIITCGPQRNCSVPEVFKHPQSKIWTMIFTEGSYLQTPSLRDYRNLVVMTSPDGATWARLPQNDVLLNPSMTAVGSLGWKDRQAFAASIVKKLSGEPELSNGRLMMLISGVRGADLHTNSGVVYLTPSIATTPLQLVQSAASSGFPKLWLKNSNNSLEDGGLDSDDTSGHVDMLVGSNFRFNKGGTTSVFDITQAAAGIYVGGGGYINLMSGAAGDSVETVLQISPDKRVNFVKPIKDVATIEGSAGGILNLKITTGTAGNSDVGILQFQSGATGISRIFGFTGSVATDAGGMLFQTRPSGGAYLSVLMMDEAGNMYFRNDAGTLKQVGYSANDSCGTGFRCIRIPN
ncbi:MAG TPA: hypothetical protein VGN95_01325, partial [Pyrinomonadaceae bacterium]|nr:hypothetical protein [Pyrinomonadaceae bacterium]